jgi:D-alanyl-D-alanine carboxypeptidase
VSAEVVPFPLPSTTALPSALRNALQNVLDGIVAAGASRGVTAAVVTATGTWTGAAGTDGADRPLVPNAMMCIGSVTKTFTAAEIVHLAGRGRLDLDAPASTYLDNPLLRRGPTVRHLLAMTSGLPEFFTDDFSAAVLADSNRNWTPDQTMAYATVEPNDAIGRYFYTNTNYLLLGQLIEKITSLNYATALRRDLLATNHGRIAIQTVEAPTPPLASPGRESGVRPDGRYLPTRAAASAAGAAGGIAADAATLARWGYDLYGARLLPPEQVRQLTTPHSVKYGLGTAIDHYNDTELAVGHEGGLYGHNSGLTVLPARQVSVAVLVPASVEVKSFSDKLIDAVLKAGA